MDLFHARLNAGLPLAPSDDTTTGVLNWITVLIGIGIGVLCGLIVGVTITWIGHLVGRKEVFTRILFRRITRPLISTLILTGGYLGLGYTLRDFDLSSNLWMGHSEHFLLILVIAGITWLLAKAVYVIEDIARRDSRGKTRDRKTRMFTQAQIIRRVLQAVIVVLGIATIMLTFPFARVAMSSILASAGVASIVATLAAQSMLANMLAGLQVAMSDAIRVGDLIQIEALDGQKELGTVEEITLTYVVMEIYDERRMVIPSSRFTQGAFENWSRRAQQLLGTVELYLDYSAPVGAIRARVDYLLSMTDVWDGRTASVHVTEMSDERMTVRILVSARNFTDLWTLKCYLREEMITWVNAEMPWALAAKRIRPIRVQQLKQDRSIHEITELAEELAGISGEHIGPTPHVSSLGETPGQTRPPVQSFPYPQVKNETPSSVPEAKKAFRLPRSKNLEQGAESPAHRARLKAARSRAQREAAWRAAITFGNSRPVENNWKQSQTGETEVLNSEQLKEAVKRSPVRRQAVFPKGYQPGINRPATKALEDVTEQKPTQRKQDD